MEVKDNFLGQKEFDELQTFMMGDDFAWFFKYGYYADPLNDDKEEAEDFSANSFIHTFYEDGVPRSSHMDQLQCFVKLLKPVAFWRIRGNLLTRSPNIIEHPLHTDMTFLAEEQLKQWTTSIFYVNTNNGYTVFEDADLKVESVANRMLTFPAYMKHTGTTCTDQQIRIIINFNYYMHRRLT